MRKLALLSCLIVLGGCTVGPEYLTPSSALPEQFSEAAAPKFQAATPVATEVWQAFGDADLNTLISSALKANQTLAEAQARLRELHALRGLIPYALFPTVIALADRTKNRPSSLDPQIPPEIGGTESYSAGFDSVWEIDLFGSSRNQSNAIKQRTEVALAELRGYELQIVAETAQAYFSLRGAQARLRLQTRNIENLSNNLRLLKLRAEAGRTSELDVARSNALGLGVAALVPEIQAQVSRHKQRLAVLLGISSMDLPSFVNAPSAIPALPDLVQVGAPEDWFKRRPDIAAAERNLAAAYSDTGTEVAEYFPKLTLLGSFGYTGKSAGDLAESSAERWRFGPSLSWRFLDIGRVRQNVRAAQARADQAQARYRQTVLLALEETEAAMANYRAAGEAAVALQMAVTQSRRAYDLAKLRFDAGASDFLVLLDAERQLIDFEDRLSQNATQRATTLAMLYKALAGDFARAAP